jgi:hypothetical protein
VADIVIPFEKQTGSERPGRCWPQAANGDRYLLFNWGANANSADEALVYDKARGRTWPAPEKT